MDFKEKVRNYLAEKNVAVGRIEQEGNNESIVCHILPEDNTKVREFSNQMEADLDVAVVLTNMYGMNVVIVESNNLES